MPLPSLCGTDHPRPTRRMQIVNGSFPKCTVPISLEPDDRAQLDASDIGFSAICDAGKVPDLFSLNKRYVHSCLSSSHSQFASMRQRFQRREPDRQDLPTYWAPARLRSPRNPVEQNTAARRPVAVEPWLVRRAEPLRLKIEKRPNWAIELAIYPMKGFTQDGYLPVKQGKLKFSG